jgi:hypothetical protein
MAMDRRVPLTPDMARLIAQAVGTCRVHASEALSAQGLDFQPAGPFKIDIDAINAAPPERQEVQGRIHATGIEAAELAFVNAQDHMLALESNVLRDPAPVWSSLTLCRAILESTVVSCHLLDPSITTDARLARIAALWLEDTSFAERSARTFGEVQAEGSGSMVGSSWANSQLAGSWLIEMIRTVPCESGSVMHPLGSG